MARDAHGSALIGRRLGAYVVEDLLGEGAMGAVYVATDVNLRREVALKVIRRSLAEDPQYCDRFLREARAAARLSHPNIVHVYSAGAEGGIAYLALELVRGGSLADLVRRAGGRLPPRCACEIARDAALGLGAAHEQGIVHRDVKPDNLLVDGDARTGRVKITDFGVARVAAGGQRITQSGLFVGTPRYASPEQCRGESLDGRSDLYSLGVCLFEMLSGTLPHESTSATPLALLSKIANDPPRPLFAVAPAVSARVAAIVDRLLEKEPAARYRDAAALARDLAAALEELPVEELALEPPTARRRREGSVAPEPLPHSWSVTTPLPESGAALAAASSSLASAPIGTPVPLGLPAPPPPPPLPSPPPPAPPPGAPRPGTAALLARIEMVERLAEGGHPVAALRAASLIAREMPAAGVAAADPLYRTLGKIVAMLRDPSGRFRGVPSLIEALEAFRPLDLGLALLAGDLADLLDSRSARTMPALRLPAGGPVHALAIVHLAELGVGLALPWKWDELAGACDDAVVPLDADGRQQVHAAATVLAGLVPSEERPALKRFNEGRQIVPVVSLRNVGAIQGTSAGLPTLIAMIAARYGLRPRRGLAATGALDASTIPPLPTTDAGRRASEGGAGAAAHHEGFLDVRIKRVEAVRAKVQAVLEQCPDVDSLVLPRANEAEVHADLDLASDLRTCGMRVIFVETVRDLLAADLFEPALAFPPLRLARGGAAAGTAGPPAAGTAGAAAAAGEPALAASSAAGLRGAMIYANAIAAGAAILAAAVALDAFGGG